MLKLELKKAVSAKIKHKQEAYMNRVPIIEFNDFTFKYFSQAEPTLHNIDLKIYPGEKILIVGPSGSGKSTLGHCLNGLIPFSYKGDIEGSLKIDGQETSDLDIFKLSKLVGTVLQDSDGQFVGLSVAEDIAFALENDMVKTAIMHERVNEVSKMVDMDSFLSSSPYDLSGGQKQRTALAGVMIDDVDILLFDEPLANLDPLTGKTAIEIIDKIHEETDKTIIIIEHRLEDVLHRHIDRVIVINDGRILADMDPHELVSTSILTENGIREPLYITALKYAGVDLDKTMLPGHIWSLKLDGCEEKLKSWHKSIVKIEDKEDEKSALRIEDMSFQYNKNRKILKDIDIDIKQGQMVAIVGKNGAGKSTLSKIICGFEKEDKGRLLHKGQDMKTLSIRERAEIIGLVMQNPNQMISKNLIYDEIALGLRLRDISEEEIRPRVEKVMEVCGLLPFISWPISALSYGQKKRVTIASILVLNPDILILDEPTAGQDYRHYSEIMDFLREINDLGITIIFITHDMHLMLEYTTRSIVLSDGMIVSDVKPSAVLTNKEIIESANLKETSLFNLAQMAGIEDETQFVQSFIDYERRTLNEK